MFAFPQVHVGASNPDGLTQPAVGAPPTDAAELHTVHAASPKAAANATPSSRSAFVPEDWFTVSSSASYAESELLNLRSGLPWRTNNSHVL